MKNTDGLAINHFRGSSQGVLSVPDRHSGDNKAGIKPQQTDGNYIKPVDLSRKAVQQQNPGFHSDDRQQTIYD